MYEFNKVEPGDLLSFEYDGKPRLLLVEKVEYNGCYHFHGCDYFVESDTTYRHFLSDKVKKLTLIDKNVKEVEVLGSDVKVSTVGFRIATYKQTPQPKVLNVKGDRSLSVRLNKENLTADFLINGKVATYEDMVEWLTD